MHIEIELTDLGVKPLHLAPGRVDYFGRMCKTALCRHENKNIAPCKGARSDGE